MTRVLMITIPLISYLNYDIPGNRVTRMLLYSTVCYKAMQYHDTLALREEQSQSTDSCTASQSLI